MNAETALMKAIQLDACRDPGVRLFRNNVGMLIDREGRPVHFGLAKGSSDLIGFESIVITPEMVGQVFARFLAVEVKTRAGRLTEPQKDFLAMVERLGGKAILARSVDDFRAKNKGQETGIS